MEKNKKEEPKVQKIEKKSNKIQVVCVAPYNFQGTPAKKGDKLEMSLINFQAIETYGHFFEKI